MKTSLPKPVIRLAAQGIGLVAVIVAVVLTFQGGNLPRWAVPERVSDLRTPAHESPQSPEHVSVGSATYSEVLTDIQWALDETDPSEARGEDILAGLFQCGRYQDAFEIARALERGIKRDFVPTAIEAWARVDGLAAWHAASLLPSRQDEMRTIVLYHWPDTQIVLLAAIILKLPEDELKRTALQHLIRKWGQSDPAAMSEWLVAHPQDNAVMDQAAEFFVYSCDSENRSPGIAAKWAARITSPERRERAMRALAHEQDPSPVTNSGLLPEQSRTR